MRINFMNKFLPFLMLFAGVLFPGLAFAMDSGIHIDLTRHWAGYFAVGLFVLSYAFVMAEEFTHMRKSKPVMLAAGCIWAVLAWIYKTKGLPHEAEQAVRHNLLEYAELMLFLLVAMTYINALEERRVFDALRSWLVRKGLGFRALFWVTGGLAFCISPVADNLTTALLMATVAMSVGGENKKFVLLSCINIVIAANAGGAFSPFGDITTLMVWQKNILATNGKIDFWTFFCLFVPALVNWLVPAIMMHFAVPNVRPHAGGPTVPMKRGALPIVALFLLTIATAVAFHNFLVLPPVLGMLTGLSFLKLFSFYLKKNGEMTCFRKGGAAACEKEGEVEFGDPVPYDVFAKLARVEWDTLLFFYGVVLCVGGLGFIGYLNMVSLAIYGGWGATYANIAIGLFSAVVDNIPVMFAVLTMMPDMSIGQWMLVTLTAGVGGSMLSIGSAAGVALMGHARGVYTFFGHLKWTPAIALGYAASIGTHMLLNKHLF